MKVSKGMTECRKQTDTYCQKDNAEHEGYDRGHSARRPTQSTIIKCHVERIGQRVGIKESSFCPFRR